MEKVYDVAIVGGGPGGYVAAIRAAQLGLSACLIEKDTPGGVCLNWGCIPSKSLIHHASEFLALAHMEGFGVKVDRSGFQYAAVHKQSREAARVLADGVAGLLRKNKVEVFKATGCITAPGEIALSGGQHDGRVVRAKNVIIATGSRPLTIKGFEFDEKRVLSSSGILALTELPKTLLILGAGAIGCEFAYVMNAFGVKVTLLEMAPQILPSSDAEVTAVLETSLRNRGIAVHPGCRAISLDRSSEGGTVTVEEKGQTRRIAADQVLVALGRVPNSHGIGLERVGVKCDERGFVLTQDYCETNVKHVFAIGDVTSSPGLAHVASKEGEIVVDYIAGHPGERQVDVGLVPSAVYCEPQVASFGLSEKQAAERGIRFKKSLFPYRAAGKAVAVGKTEGLVKILAEVETGEILGAHIVGTEATELIHELLLAKHGELLVDDVQAMIHAHPTISESLMEAARGVFGKPVHV